MRTSNVPTADPMISHPATDFRDENLSAHSLAAAGASEEERKRERLSRNAGPAAI
jgi:hypothetical protein